MKYYDFKDLSYTLILHGYTINFVSRYTFVATKDSASYRVSIQNHGVVDMIDENTGEIGVAGSVKHALAWVSYAERRAA